MLSILKIINSHFWKSIFGPFFAFVFPLIFVAILGSMLGYDQLFGGTMAIASMSIALTAMPQALFEFKRSALLKRIGVTPIKPWMFLLVTAGFYAVIMFVSSFWVFIMSLAFYSKNWTQGNQIFPGLNAQSFSDVLNHINWGGFIWGLLMNIMVALSLGLLLVSTAKSTLAIQGIGIPILIISQFLSAQVLPLPMIKSTDFMSYVSYLSPFKYSTSLLIESLSGNIDPNFTPTPPIPGPDGVVPPNFNLTIASSSNIFDVNNPFSMIEYKGSKLVVMFGKVDKILNLVIPFVLTGIFSGIAVKTFKWSDR